MAEQLAFPRLFETAYIGKVRLKNRVVMLPMGTSFATPSGEVSDRTIDYFVERAKGGFGRITIGNISPFLPNHFNQLVMGSDVVLMGHFELVEKVHAQGAKITAQFSHAGKHKHPIAMAPGEELIGPSAIPSHFMGQPFPAPRALSRGEVYQFIEKFAAAAGRARKIGYDTVEYHGSHGQIVNQFISPHTNKRTDEFGGSLENRMRFILELVKATRQAVGPDCPIGIRFNSREFVPDGITLDESRIMARMLEAAGVDYLSVSAGAFEDYDKFECLMRDPEGWKEYLWEAIKKEVKIPIVAGGGLRHPDFCERLLEQGKADFIGLARPSQADAKWPNKAREGRVEDIRLCISCNECIIGTGRRRAGGGARRCSVNAAFGRENDFAEIKAAPVSKKVMVVGGGPGGMEAARIAAIRGHKVTLYDKGKELGGQLLIAGKPESKKKLMWFRDYLVTQLTKLGVEVKLGVEATPRLVQGAKPDAVVVATGAEPVLPNIPGIDRANVVSGWDLLRGKKKPKNQKVAVVGGGMIGCEIADYLLESGNTVTIIEQLPAVASDMEPMHRFRQLEIFKDKNVAILTNRKVTAITAKGIKALNPDSGKEEMIEADLVVVAVGAKAVDTLINALEGNVPELYPVGDCSSPRVILEAVHEGSAIGRII